MPFLRLPAVFYVRTCCFIILLIWLAVKAVSTKKLRHSARSFEKGLRFSPFCGILIVRHNFIEVHNGVQFCDFVLLFSVMDKIVSQQCEVHFRGVLHVVGHTFLYSKISQKTFEKNIGIINY